MTATPWQLLPELAQAEFAALKADIAAHGVRVPVVIDASSGAVVDGHHRIRAVEELRSEGVKLDYPRQVVAFRDDDERVGFVVGANLFRRHFTRAQRAGVVAKLREQGWSLRRIGEAVGVDHKTALADLAEIGEDSPISERVERKGGGTYPARRPVAPPSVFARAARDEARARDALQVLGGEAPSRVLDLRDAERRARKADYERMRDATTPAEHAQGNRFELRCGDFAEVLADIPAGSVDLVFCDPPYVTEFDDRWVDLAEVSARILAPGAAAVFYTGHHNLPEVLDALGRHLSWLWHIAVVQAGRESRMNAPRVHNGHRDLLVFANGTYRPRRWMRDTLSSAAADKSLHPWQQALDPARYLIDVLCDPGGLVCDPCCGAGTFGVAALLSGRRFVGVDIDPVTLGVATKRLGEAERDARDGEGA